MEHAIINNELKEIAKKSMIKNKFRIPEGLKNIKLKLSNYIYITG
jgi:hypothetical protein